MGNTIRKLKPGEYWNIAEYESWLSDMARQGFYLKKAGLLFATFTKSEPRQMRYRIKVAPYIKDHDQFSFDGWEYVTSYGPRRSQCHVFSSPAELNAREFVDSYGLSYDLKPMQRELTEQSVGTTVIISLMLIMYFFISVKIGMITFLSLLELGFELCCIMYIALLFEGAFFIKAACSVHRLRKKLSLGKPMNHSAGWKRKRNAYAIFYICLLLILVLMISTVVFVFEGTEKTLPEEHSGMPIVRLADIEQNPDLVRKSEFLKGTSRDLYNYCRYEWSLLAPIQYESEEHGTVPNVQNKNGGGVYSPSVSSAVYKTTIPFMNKAIVSDLMKKYVDEFENSNVTKIQDPNFDELYIAKCDSGCQVYAVKGRGILYIEYRGNADETAVIEAAAETIGKIAV